METIRKRKKNSIKKRWVLSVLLSVVLSVSQLLPSGVLAADPTRSRQWFQKRGGKIIIISTLPKRCKSQLFL
jgi:hypothetical protein